MNNINSSLLDQLKQTANGLLFISESEHPFQAFLWEAKDKEALTPKKLLQYTSHSWDIPIKVLDLDHFFRNATTEQDWHDPTEKEIVKKYQTLVKRLRDRLVDIKVYKLGTRNIDVYIVGKTVSGNYAGLSTKVVET